jgi:hypothetical protein
VWRKVLSGKQPDGPNGEFGDIPIGRAYGEIVEQPFGLNLVTTAKPDGYAAGLFVLLSTLKSFEGYYKQAGDSVRKLNDCFERIDPPKK